MFAEISHISHVTKTSQAFLVAPLFNVSKVLGGARIYQRKEGGPLQFDCFVENGEGRIRHPLKTSEKAFATREAEEVLSLEVNKASATVCERAQR